MSSNIPNGYLPFDLETALKQPERVVTREGKPVTQLTKFDVEDEYNLCGCLNDGLETWCTDGRYRQVGTLSDEDLFLLPEAEIIYNNIYPKGKSGLSFETLQMAKNASHYQAIAIQKTTITGRDVKVEIVHTFNDGE